MIWSILMWVPVAFLAYAGVYLAWLERRAWREYFLSIFKDKSQ